MLSRLFGTRRNLALSSPRRSPTNNSSPRRNLALSSPRRNLALSSPRRSPTNNSSPRRSPTNNSSPRRNLALSSPRLFTRQSIITIINLLVQMAALWYIIDKHYKLSPEMAMKYTHKFSDIYVHYVELLKKWIGYSQTIETTAIALTSVVYHKLISGTIRAPVGLTNVLYGTSMGVGAHVTKSQLTSAIRVLTKMSQNGRIGKALDFGSAIIGASVLPSEQIRALVAAAIVKIIAMLVVAITASGRGTAYIAISELRRRGVVGRRVAGFLTS